MTTPTVYTFDEPQLHVVVLGSLAPLGDEYNLTAADQPDGHIRGNNLTWEQYDFLTSLDPTVHDRAFTLEEKALLLALARSGVVKLLTENDTLSGLDFVPVPHKKLSAVESLPNGYRFRVEGGDEFTLSELGARFLQLADGTRQLTQIVDTTKLQLLSDEKSRAVVEEEVAEQGRALDAILFEEAMAFVKALRTSGAGTYEPVTDAK